MQSTFGKYFADKIKYSENSVTSYIHRSRQKFQTKLNKEKLKTTQKKYLFIHLKLPLPLMSLINF